MKMSLREEDIKTIKERFRKDAFSRVENLVTRMPYSSEPDDLETPKERKKLKKEYCKNLKQYLTS